MYTIMSLVNANERYYQRFVYTRRFAPGHGLNSAVTCHMKTTDAYQ